LNENSGAYAPHLILLPAIEAVKEAVKPKIKEFGTNRRGTITKRK